MGYTESPLVDGDKVIVTPGGSKGTIVALNKKSGEVIWQSKEFKDGAQYSSLIAIDFGGTHQYVQMTGNHIVGVRASDGAELWKFERRGPTAAIPTPVYSNGYVFVTSGYGAGCNLIKLTKDGETFKATEVYANKDMVNHHGGVLKVGDYLYGHSDSGGWACIDFMTGKIAAGWLKPDQRGKLPKGSITYADGHLYCYSERDGTLALIAASPDGWKETGRFKIPERTKLDVNRETWTHPVVSNGKLYLRDHDSIFCCDVSGDKSS